MGRVEINPFVHFPFLKAYIIGGPMKQAKFKGRMYVAISVSQYNRIWTNDCNISRLEIASFEEEIISTPLHRDSRDATQIWAPCSYTPHADLLHISHQRGDTPNSFLPIFLLLFFMKIQPFFFLPPSSWGVGYYSQNKMKLCASLVM